MIHVIFPSFWPLAPFSGVKQSTKDVKIKTQKYFERHSSSDTASQARKLKFSVNKLFTFCKKEQLDLDMGGFIFVYFSFIL